MGDTTGYIIISTGENGVILCENEHIHYCGRNKTVKYSEFRDQSTVCRVIMLLYNSSKTFSVSLEEIVILELKDRR